MVSSLAESWPGRIPAPRWPLRLLPHAGQLGWALLFHGRPVFTVGRGGQLCPAHVTGKPWPSLRVRGWEQLATGSPRTKGL